MEISAFKSDEYMLNLKVPDEDLNEIAFNDADDEYNEAVNCEPLISEDTKPSELFPMICAKSKEMVENFRMQKIRNLTPQSFAEALIEKALSQIKNNVLEPNSEFSSINQRLKNNNSHFSCLKIDITHPDISYNRYNIDFGVNLMNEVVDDIPPSDDFEFNVESDIFNQNDNIDVNYLQEDAKLHANHGETRENSHLDYPQKEDTLKTEKHAENKPLSMKPNTLTDYFFDRPVIMEELKNLNPVKLLGIYNSQTKNESNENLEAEINNVKCNDSPDCEHVGFVNPILSAIESSKIASPSIIHGDFFQNLETETNHVYHYNNRELLNSELDRKDDITENIVGYQESNYTERNEQEQTKVKNGFSLKMNNFKFSGEYMDNCEEYGYRKSHQKVLNSECQNLAESKLGQSFGSVNQLDSNLVSTKLSQKKNKNELQDPQDESIIIKDWLDTEDRQLLCHMNFPLNEFRDIHKLRNYVLTGNVTLPKINDEFSENVQNNKKMKKRTSHKKNLFKRIVNIIKRKNKNALHHHVGNLSLCDEEEREQITIRNTMLNRSFRRRKKNPRLSDFNFENRVNEMKYSPKRRLFVEKNLINSSKKSSSATEGNRNIQGSDSNEALNLYIHGNPNIGGYSSSREDYQTQPGTTTVIFFINQLKNPRRVYINIPASKIKLKDIRNALPIAFLNAKFWFKVIDEAFPCGFFFTQISDDNACVPLCDGKPVCMIRTCKL